MSLPSQRGSDTAARKEFQHGFQVLDRITSWHLGSGVTMILLAPAMIILLWFPSLLAQLSLSPTSFVGGLLSVVWVFSGVTLYHQRLRLELLRKDLIEQADAATKHRVRGEQFYGLSTLDPLTGLFNRRIGETRLQEEISRAQATHDPLLVLAIDFDRFKEINDKYGHAAGDLALKEFSRRLQRALRACDVPVRMGGDEFLVILPECRSDKINMILSRMGSIEVNHEGNRIPVSFSHGMAQYEENDTPESLIKRADERLYANKARRKTDDQWDPSTATKPVISMADSNLPAGDQQPARTSPARIRRSARIARELGIFLIGHDLNGRVFLEQTNTVDLSQHGAWVLSQQKLAPDQEIIIRRQDTDKEAEVRIVRVIGSQPDGYAYGVAFVSPDANIWGFECSPFTESEEKTLQLLYECSSCGGRTMFGDSDPSEGRAASNVERSCDRCGSETTWNRVANDEVHASVA